MKITVPSYVIPGTYRENVEYLIDKTAISGIELLFFMYDDQTHALFQAEKEAIEAQLSRFSYTLHLPDTLLPEHRRIVEETRHIADHYIVHPPRTAEAPSLGSFLPSWIEAFGSCFLLENTRFDLFEKSLEELPGIGICCDTGHLLLEGRSPREFIDSYGPRIGQFHLHGLGKDDAEDNAAEKDHNPVRKDNRWLQDITPFLKDFSGPVELELFSYRQVEESLEVLSHFGLL
jgi:sugar phosphate isomerase/epimerase